MINPLNGDKPLSSAMERSGESQKNARTEPTAIPPNASDSGNEAPASPNVEVDQARQLYNLEQQVNRPVAASIDTPEAARSLLSTVLQQLQDNPDQAFRTQASNASAPLARLLEQAPA